MYAGWGWIFITRFGFIMTRVRTTWWRWGCWSRRGAWIPHLQHSRAIWSRPVLAGQKYCSSSPRTNQTTSRHTHYHPSSSSYHQTLPKNYSFPQSFGTPGSGSLACTGRPSRCRTTGAQLDRSWESGWNCVSATTCWWWVRNIGRMWGLSSVGWLGTWFCVSRR